MRTLKEIAHDVEWTLRMLCEERVAWINSNEPEERKMSNDAMKVPTIAQYAEITDTVLKLVAEYNSASRIRQAIDALRSELNECRKVLAKCKDKIGDDVYSYDSRTRFHATIDERLAAIDKAIK